MHFSLTQTVEHTVSLLCIATFVAIVARRLALPYTVGLVLTGIGLAATRLATGAMLTHDFIFEVILPPLLFEAAINIHWRELRRDLLPVLTLSTLGVAVSAAFVAAGMSWLLSWPIGPAVVFAVLIAATDPVAVIALFKDVGVKGRLRLLVESESLFNDGVAAVLFALALAWSQTPQASSTNAVSIALTLVQTAGGGILIGIAAGAVAILIAWRTSDHLVETTLTALAAYGSFLLANSFQLSGVLATVTAGLLMGNLGILNEDQERSNVPALGREFVVAVWVRKLIGHEKRVVLGREFVIAFWEFAAFIANSLVFLLIGLRVADVGFNTNQWSSVVGAIVLVLVGRAITVYPLCLPFARSRWRISPREQHVLWWGGLRGALALALALALPVSFSFDGQILIAAFAVVTFSVVVQGLTMPLLMKWLGIFKGGRKTA